MFEIQKMLSSRATPASSRGRPGTHRAAAPWVPALRSLRELGRDDRLGFWKKTRSVTLMLATLLLASPVLAASAPRVALDSIANLPVVERNPYDEAATPAQADAAVNAAFARAAKNHKLVFIDLGGNWCGDCVVLANIMLLPEMKPFMAAHYEVVSIDTGRNDKNLQIPKRFGTDLSGGVPTVLIVKPDGKTLVNAGHIAALEDARHMTPQAVADWLAQWTP
jgi:thiol:disulfide interchange protein